MSLRMYQAKHSRSRSPPSRSRSLPSLDADYRDYLHRSDDREPNVYARDDRSFRDGRSRDERACRYERDGRGRDLREELRRERKRRRSSERNEDRRKEKRERNRERESLEKSRDESLILGALGSVYDYEYTGEISAGAFGIVFKGQAKNGRTVAIKKLKITKNDNGNIYLREIRHLQILNHKNIIKLIEVVTNKNDEKFLVFEFCQFDLKNLISEFSPLGISMVKSIMKQVFEGLKVIHQKKLIHRDIKPENILIDANGIVKIADFGSSRKLERDGGYTPGMVTLRYRAPEIFLGSKNYTQAIDLWSCGCLMTELILGKPLLDGTSDLEQIDKMCEVLGSPTLATWPSLSSLPNSKNLIFPKQEKNHLKKFLGNVSANCYLLISKLFIYDPENRIRAGEALQSGFFEEDPKPCQNALAALDIVYSSPLNAEN